MKKTQKQATRRRAALKWSGAAVLLLAALLLLGEWRPLPRMALRQNEETQGTGATQVVANLGRLPLGAAPRRVYFTANQEVAMLSEVSLSLAGWSYGAACTLDCTGEGPVHMAYWMVSARGEEAEGESYIYCFGRVDDPAIYEVGMAFGQRDASGALTFPDDFAGSTLSAPRENWLRQGDHDYFVVSAPLDKARQGEGGDYYLTIDGLPVQPEERVTNWISTSIFG